MSNKLKVLNLYAGIGGNRKLWTDVDVTAVELDPDIAKIYQSYFPEDVVVLANAKKWLLLNYMDYDFIWASPPCPTHSRARYWGWHNKKPVYPDFTLYEIITFLKHHYNGLWVVENVMPYYDPLIHPSAKIGRHMFWSNFRIGSFKHESSDLLKLSGTSFKDKLKRNKVAPEIGGYILNCARNIITKSNVNQLDFFINEK